MSEWLSYRPSDFILFSAQSWWRTIALANADVWPTQLLTVAIGVAAMVVVVRRPLPQPSPASRRGGIIIFAWLGFAACWVWVAWAFHVRHHAAINWAAPGFAAAFGIEALLLAAAAFAGGGVASGLRRGVGLSLLAAAIAGYPLLAPLFDRPWVQAEVFGLAPDPTALATIGWLLVQRSRHAAIAIALWPIPIVSLAAGAVTLGTMR